MPVLLHDLRSAIASLRRAPAFAAAVVATLALGIAPNCVIFSIMDAVYFKPLPYPAQERLILLNVSHPSKATLDVVDDFTFVEWQRRAAVVERMAVYRNAPISLNWNDKPERVPGQLVSADFFAVLGIRPRLGRGFDVADERPGAPPVVVVSHRTWQDYFSGRADVVGLTLRVNGSPATVVGVMPPEFVSFMEGRTARAWMPMTLAPGSSPEPRAAGNVVARLQPGASVDSARAAMQAAHAALAGQHAEFYRDRAASVRDFRSSLHGGIGPGIRMLSVLVGLVLFIACGNAANLLLGRAAQRRREVAVRTALGARRLQLVRALLVEGLTLASIGAALGLVVGYWAVVLVWSQTAPIFQVIGVDGFPFDRRVFGFAALLAAAVTVLFGAVPALRESRVDLVEALKDGTAGAGAGARRLRLSRVVVVGQVALCMVTMVAAILVLQGVARFAGVASNPGFRPRALLVATLPAPGGAALASGPRLAVLDEVRRRVASVATVDAVAFTDRVPFLDAAHGVQVATPSMKAGGSEGTETFDAGLRAVGGDFFAVMSMPLVRGRAFTAGDGAEGALVAIVSDRLAAARWKDRDPIGDRVQVHGAWRTVVGVVTSSVRPTPFRSDPGELFVPLSQSQAADVRLLVRSPGPIEQLAPAIRQEVRAADHDQPVADLRTMEEELGRFMTPFRLILGLTLAFSGIALSLAAIGLYGVVAHSVARRTREMGVRMALGAGRREVRRLVVGEGLRLAVIGLVVGLLPGAALVRILPAALLGVGGLSPLHFAAAIAVWLAVALVACLLPARRAAAVQPLAALRCE